MKVKTIRRSIPFSTWPFEKDEFAKLYWIDHPYRDRLGDWKIALFFKRLPDGEIRRCDVQWGTLTLLRYGHIYKGGNLLTTIDEIPDEFLGHLNNKHTNFTFHKVAFKCIEGKHTIITADGKKHNVMKNAFIADYEGKSIHIPVIEVIRADLTNNRKLIYAILEPNGLDNYFILTYNYNSNSVLTMNFSKEYPHDLLTKSNINHLLRISLEPNAKKAWNGVYRSIQKYDSNGIVFSFPYNGDFDMECRYREDNNIIRIEEISRIYPHKGLEYISTVIIRSPHLKHVVNLDRSKERKFIDKSPDDDIQIDADSGNARKAEKTITVEGTEHIYEKYPNLIFTKAGTITRNTKEDEDTQVIIREDDSAVSTGDIGGMDKLEGLEFESVSSQVKRFGGELGEFLEAIKYIEQIYPNVKVLFTVNTLPEGIRGKRFYLLDDGITHRKYSIARVYFNHNVTIFIVEVERVGKPLSMLLLKSSNKSTNINIYSVTYKIMSGLVNNNGVWDNMVIDELVNSGIEISRIKHMRNYKNVNEHAEKLYEKIVNFALL